MLLIKSIEKWFYNFQYKIYVYSPRKQFWPKQETLNFLDRDHVVWLNHELNVDFKNYPIANKVLACQHFEQTYLTEGPIIFLDTDTVFTNPIGIGLLKKANRLLLRPVDNKGPGSESKHDVNDEFWQEVFNLCNVSIPPPSVLTTVSSLKIRNYFNAGLIWVCGLKGFYNQWYDDFLTIVDSGLRPFGYMSRDGNDFRCLDQVALAVTATRYKAYLEILPESLNYPIPFKSNMQNHTNHLKLNELVHIHYHKWFQHPGFLDHITTENEKLSEQYIWLKKQLPLKPEINEPFKRWK